MEGAFSLFRIFHSRCVCEYMRLSKQNGFSSPSKHNALTPDLFNARELEDIKLYIPMIVGYRKEESDSNTLCRERERGFRLANSFVRDKYPNLVQIAEECEKAMITNFSGGNSPLNGEFSLPLGDDSGLDALKQTERILDIFELGEISDKLMIVKAGLSQALVGKETDSGPDSVQYQILAQLLNAKCYQDLIGLLTRYVMAIGHLDGNVDTQERIFTNILTGSPDKARNLTRYIFATLPQLFPGFCDFIVDFVLKVSASPRKVEGWRIASHHVRRIDNIMSESTNLNRSYFTPILLEKLSVLVPNSCLKTVIREYSSFSGKSNIMIAHQLHALHKILGDSIGSTVNMVAELSSDRCRLLSDTMLQFIRKINRGDPLLGVSEREIFLPIVSICNFMLLRENISDARSGSEVILLGESMIEMIFTFILERLNVRHGEECYLMCLGFFFCFGGITLERISDVGSGRTKESSKSKDYSDMEDNSLKTMKDEAARKILTFDISLFAEDEFLLFKDALVLSLSHIFLKSDFSQIYEVLNINRWLPVSSSIMGEHSYAVKSALTEALLAKNGDINEEISKICRKAVFLKPYIGLSGSKDLFMRSFAVSARPTPPLLISVFQVLLKAKVKLSPPIVASLTNWCLKQLEMTDIPVSSSIVEMVESMVEFQVFIFTQYSETERQNAGFGVPFPPMTLAGAFAKYSLPSLIEIASSESISRWHYDEGCQIGYVVVLLYQILLWRVRKNELFAQQNSDSGNSRNYGMNSGEVANSSCDDDMYDEIVNRVPIEAILLVCERHPRSFESIYQKLYSLVVLEFPQLVVRVGHQIKMKDILSREEMRLKKFLGIVEISNGFSQDLAGGGEEIRQVFRNILEEPQRCLSILRFLGDTMALPMLARYFEYFTDIIIPQIIYFCEKMDRTFDAAGGSSDLQCAEELVSEMHSIWTRLSAFASWDLSLRTAAAFLRLQPRNQSKLDTVEYMERMKKATNPKINGEDRILFPPRSGTSPMFSLSQNTISHNPQKLFGGTANCVFKMEKLYEILIELVWMFMIANRNHVNRRLVVISPQEREEATNILLTQESAIVQMLLDRSLFEASESRKSGIHRIMETFLHSIFVENVVLMKLVHFQTYPLQLINIMVDKIPSLHICTDFMPEMFQKLRNEQSRLVKGSFSLTELNKRKMFAHTLTSKLISIYPLERNLKVLEEAFTSIERDLDELRFCEEYSIQSDILTFLIECLPLLPAMVAAFPMRKADAIKLLKKVLAHTKLLEKNLKTFQHRNEMELYLAMKRVVEKCIYDVNHSLDEDEII